MSKAREIGGSPPLISGRHTAKYSPDWANGPSLMFDPIIMLAYERIYGPGSVDRLFRRLGRIMLATIPLTVAVMAVWG